MLEFPEEYQTNFLLIKLKLELKNKLLSIKKLLKSREKLLAVAII